MIGGRILGVGWCIYCAMAHNFGSLVFTPAIKALQEKYGSRRQYARMEEGGAAHDRLGEDEIAFIGESDSFYMATVGSTGWPYIQHRGGPPGFLKVVDDRTLSFPDYRGNKQFITTGNLETDNRVALILVDYPRQARLKILGRAEVIGKEFVIRIEAFDWNCPQHITPRFTEAQIKEVLAPVEKRMAALEEENRKLREALAQPSRA
jgi:predicted pyridoxine 5'-phosphate oxidase superfamily flavin-nucleotide-binding protein